MNKYKTIKDGRVLKAVARRYMTDFDKKYKYCLMPSQCPANIEYKGNIYRLMYISGCFYPYLVKLEKGEK